MKSDKSDSEQKGRNPLRIAFTTGEDLNGRSDVNSQIIDYYGWFKGRGHNVTIAGPYNGPLDLEGRVEEKDVIKAGDWIDPGGIKGSYSAVRSSSGRYLQEIIPLIRNHQIIHMNDPGIPGFQPFLLLSLSPLRKPMREPLLLESLLSELPLPKRMQNSALLNLMLQKSLLSEQLLRNPLRKQTLNFATFNGSQNNPEEGYVQTSLLNIPLVKFIMTKTLDHTLAVSEDAKNYAKKYFPGEHLLIPNSIDNKKFSPEGERLEYFKKMKVYDPEKLNILMPTSDNYTIDALINLNKNQNYRNKVRFILSDPVGVNETFWDGLKMLSKQNESNYVICDDIPSSMLPDFYRSADAVVLPTSNSRNQRRTMIEAQACGTPVLAPNIEEYAPIAAGDVSLTYADAQNSFLKLQDRLLSKGQGTILYNPYNSDSLESGIKVLVDWPGIVETMKNEARSNSKNFSLDVVALNLETMYRSCLEKTFSNRTTQDRSSSSYASS